jgi:hypothetical protein
MFISQHEGLEPEFKEPEDPGPKKVTNAQVKKYYIVFLRM